jgi:chorismate mutase
MGQPLEASTRWRGYKTATTTSRIIIVNISIIIIGIIIMTSFPSSPSSSILNSSRHHCHALASSPTSPWNSRLYSSFKDTQKQRRMTKSPSSSSTITTTSLHSATANGDAVSTSTTTSEEAVEDVVNGNGEGGGGGGPIQKDYDDDDVDVDIHLKTSEVLSLDSIRASLIRQEETIIFALIERAQFRQNLVVYEPDGLGRLGTPPGSRRSRSRSQSTTKETTKKRAMGEVEGSFAVNDDDAATDTNNGEEDNESLSFLEYMLAGTEALHYAVRRYMSPEEHAFFPDRLPTNKKILRDLDFPSLLSDVGGASELNFNTILLQKYIDAIVPSICQLGDDEQHGSTALCDVALLQALSKRVHYGKFVAESKFLGDPDGYRALVANNDADGVMKLLTNESVEAKVLRRARLKAATYGTEPLLADLPPFVGERERTSLVAAAAASAVVAAIEAMGDTAKDGKHYNKVCPSTVENIYRDIIIPLTKDIEVAYLFRRCGRDPPPQFGPDRMSTDIDVVVEDDDKDTTATTAAAADS